MAEAARRPGAGVAAAERFVEGFDYPMFVVTTAAGGERSGCLVGFATQTGIEPFRFLVCLSKNNHTHRVARRASHLIVHVPGRDQLDLAELFGSETGDEIDKFAGVRWTPGPGGAPLLADCPRWLAGEIRHRMDLGDHTGFLLAPVDAGARPHDAGPLMFAAARRLTPGHPA